jgi:hypothetical protein
VAFEAKIKWHVQKLLARKEQQIVRRWLREVETLSDTGKVVHICEPEVRKSLSDEGSNCQGGNRKRSTIDLINFQEGRDENSDFQVGNEMRSSEDLIDCREGRRGGQGKEEETV